MNKFEAKAQDTKRKQELAAIREKEDWKWLLSDERGVRIVNQLIAHTGAFRASFAPNAMTQSFVEGQRNEGLYILDRVGRSKPDVIPVLFAMRDNDE